MTDKRGQRGAASTRMTLVEAERIIEHIDAGRINPNTPEVQPIVYDAYRRINRAMLWGASTQDPIRRRTVKILIASGLFVMVAAIALIVPLLLATPEL